MSTTHLSLRNEPDFVRWVAAEGVSLVGSAVTTVVLPLVVFEATGSAAQTGVLFALRVVPYLLFGLIAGPVADRGNRRLLIIGGNIVEGTLVATIPIAHALGVLTVAQVYAVALLSATAFVFSDAAVFGAVPALVGPDRLPAANGLLSSIASGAEIAGPVIAGLLIAGVGATTVIWVDAVSFWFASAVQSTIRSDFRAAHDPEHEKRGLRATQAAALRFIRRERTIAVLLLAGFANSTAFGIVFALLVPYAVDELDIPVGDGRIGLLYGAIGVGSLMAGMSFSRVYARRRIRYLSPGSLAISGVIAAVLAIELGWVAAIVLLALFSCSTTITIVIGITYRQMASPDHLRSSVNVIGRMVAWGGQPFGAVTGAVVASLVSILAAYATASAIMLVAAAAAAIALNLGRGGGGPHGATNNSVLP
jgi:MFS family permease